MEFFIYYLHLMIMIQCDSIRFKSIHNLFSWLHLAKIMLHINNNNKNNSANIHVCWFVCLLVRSCFYEALGILALHRFFPVPLSAVRPRNLWLFTHIPFFISISNLYHRNAYARICLISFSCVRMHPESSLIVVFACMYV